VKRDDVIATLKAHRAELEKRGVVHASVAGGHNGRQDVDIVVDLGPDADVTVYGFLDIQDYVDRLFPGGIELINKDALRLHPGRERGSRPADAF
jgi:hypothetical protein